MNTRDVDEIKRIFRRIGYREGLAEGALSVYRIRFGAPPVAVVTAIEAADDCAELERLIGIMATLSVEEIAAALRKPRAKPTARVTRARRSTGPGLGRCGSGGARR